MSNIFSAKIVPLVSNNKLYNIKAGINEEIFLDKTVPEEYLKLTMLSKQFKELKEDSFVKLGNANPSAYERFKQNVNNRKIVSEALDKKQLINEELRMFDSVDAVKAAKNIMFNIDKMIKLITKRANIDPKIVQEEFLNALKKLI